MICVNFSEQLSNKIDPELNKFSNLQDHRFLIKNGLNKLEFVK